MVFDWVERLTYVFKRCIIKNRVEIAPITFNTKGDMTMSSKVIVTMTTKYPDFLGADSVRFDLALGVCQEARQQGYEVVIADASPDAVKRQFEARGAHVFAQEDGMGPGRRQVWNEASCLVTADTRGILWTEEKPALIREVPSLVETMVRRKAKVLIPGRTQDAWQFYPSFQVQTEKVCLDVYNALFARGNETFDPMFGPVLFCPSVLTYFSGETFSPGQWGLSDTYLQHWVPIYLRHLGMSVVSQDVPWEYPVEQRQQEEGPRLKDMLVHRLRQQGIFVSGYLKLHKLFSPLPY